MAHKLVSPGKKGGKTFPRINLADAAEYARKLVSKTFTGAQPRTTIFKGVFNASGTSGEVRASALRQYGLLDGGNSALTASKLARDLAAATPETRSVHLRMACLSPNVFKTLHDTFKGDTVSVGKVRQQVVQIGVHIDNADTCSDLFLQSLETAGLAQRAGEQFQISGLDESDAAPENTDLSDTESQTSAADSTTSDPPAPPSPPPPPAPLIPALPDVQGAPSARSIIHVNVTLDSSLDTDKLQRQLELLRRFGAL